MNKVASTDQGRLIALSGKAIELTGEGARDNDLLHPLLDHLQAYKEGKPYQPPSAPALSCCGYPHYDDPKRPNFGSKQVRYLCQLYPGLLVRWYYKNGIGQLWRITSYPYYKEKSGWWIKKKYVSGIAAGREDEISLADENITPNSPENWNRSNRLEFDDSQAHCHHHCHH